MSNSGETAKRPNEALEKVLSVLRKIGGVIRSVGDWMYKLRKIILSVPVIYFAVSLAINNLAQLPDQVGFNLQASGTYAQTVSKGLAVVGPLGITAACLLLMLCSRKVLYPWLISMFTLILPVLILFMNTYPA